MKVRFAPISLSTRPSRAGSVVRPNPPASLNDPNIVAVYDTGEDVLDGDGEHVMVPYIVMEYVDGQYAARVDEQGRRLLPERSLEIMSGVLSALDYPTPTASSTATSNRAT